MELSIKHIGASRSRPATLIYLQCTSNQNVLTEDVTYVDGSVDVDLIQSLRDIADELELQNKLVKEKNL